jgi:hypothetical protein
MSFETTSASFLRPLGEPTPEARFREEYHQAKAAKTPSRSRKLLDASAIDALRAIELANLHGQAAAL